MAVEGLGQSLARTVRGALHQHLVANRVKLSIRKGALRFSLHVFNTARDVARVLELVKQAW